MIKFFISLLVVIGLLISCPKNVECSDPRSKITNRKAIDLKVDLEEQNKIQVEVDNGHQPWRLEPIDVALEALNKIDKDVDYRNCYLITETDNEAKVKCKRTMNYLIFLKRIVRPNGIWTVLSIEIE